MNFKKGATSVPMMIGIVVISILVIIIALGIYSYIAELRVSDEFSCQSTFNVLEAVKSSPGNELKIEFNTYSAQVNEECFTEKMYIDAEDVDSDIYENPTDPMIVIISYSKLSDSYLIKIEEGVL